MQIAFTNAARTDIAKYFYGNKYKDFYAYLKLLSLGGTEGFSRNNNVKRYEYSNEGLWVVRFRNYRIFCTISAKFNAEDILLIHKVIDRSDS